MNEHELFAKALAFAAEKHVNQKRRDGTPYIYHPLTVANLVKEAGYGIKYQIVAILHDTLEDTDATEEEIQIFGDDVLHSVKLLTRLPGMDEEKYIEEILNDHMAAVTKNADKIHNLWELAFIDSAGQKRSESAKSFGKRYIEKSRKYYQGKFSSALDDSLSCAKSFIGYEIVGEKEYPAYSNSEMKLYIDIEKEN